MEKRVFRRHLILKLVISAVFLGMAIGSLVAINYVNNDIIAPNEGFITSHLCKIDTDAKNSLGDRLAIEIEQEGIVLAKNADNILPLKKSNNKVNVFGFDVTQWVISDSGSGTANAGKSQKTWGLLEVLDQRGITYNKDIINYYKNWASPRDRSTLSYSSSHDVVYRLTNPSLTNDSDYRDLYDAALGETDTAIVVIGRWGGEHLDPPHQQVNNHKSKKSKNLERGYLELTEEEEDLLTNVGGDYDKVIVIINSTNVMQMDFMEKIGGLDACLIVGPTGTMGAIAVPQIIWGDVAPSGRTADTWPMKHQYNVTYYTNGYWPENGDTSKAAAAMYYTGVPSGANLANRNSNTGHGHACFADYIEGVYVGYKWFETADKMHFWDGAPYNGYENVVAYPFGHGLSYAEFDWELVSASVPDNTNITENQDITFQVKFTNRADSRYPGRDVVEVYFTPQYYTGEIEKPYVSLVGYQKTNLLQPGESEIVEITIHTRDFLTFDCYGLNPGTHVGWELDRGNYEVKFMTSSHCIKEDMVGGNTLTYVAPDTINVDQDTTTGNEVKPLFTGANAIDGVSSDGKSIGEPVNFITRANFQLPTAMNPTRPWNSGLVTCDDSSKPTAYSTKMARDWDNATVDVFGKTLPTTAPTFNSGGKQKVLDSNNQLTELGEELAADYNSPKWDSLLDQLVWSDSTKIPTKSSYARFGIPSLGLKTGNSSDYRDAEGASQVGADLSGDRRLTAYPCPTLQGQCWNERMLYLFGLSESMDMIIGGKDALYGPASNIHRSPYGGRNAEYHSEDGFLAGRCLANVTKGLADGGKMGFIKHFCVNDTEYHRVGLFTWITEQALREIYLRPFEESVKRGEATALMSSFNRIGAVWTGGSQALMQGVLRNEWGFHGCTITDYTENGTLQDANQQFRAGGNYILADSNFSDPGQSNATVRFKWRVRENAKQVVYAHIRAQYTNNLYNANPENRAIVSGDSKLPWIWWKPLLHCAEAAVVVLFIYGCVAALLPTDPDFRSELKKRFSKKKPEEK